MEFTLGKKIDRRDLLEPQVTAFPIFQKLRRAFVKRWLERGAKTYWSKHPLLEYAETHQRISEAITGGKGFSVGRLGGVEAAIILWKEARGCIPWNLLHSFSDTESGALNAGIRPRNKESYGFFAKICRDALDGMDLQGVWKSGYEAACLRGSGFRLFHDGEITGPSGTYPKHWLCALQGRKVLVVSPFQSSITAQILRLGCVWPCMDWMVGTKFLVEPFPYLIEEDCPETWWEVYDLIGKVVSRGEYDVALFGCGGLGLPLAHLAKKAGKVGIHMGGHLQLVFGIYGQRHLQQHWFRDQMNENWVRPDASEVPKSAKRVEGGCYW